MVSVDNLSISFGARTLFSNLSFAVEKRERIALAGHNGAGKSTLLKCIAGMLEPSEGRIILPKGAHVGYLPQEGIHIEGVSLWEEVESVFGEMRRLQDRIESLSKTLYQLDPRSAPYAQVLDEIGALELRLEAHLPEAIKPKIESILNGLGFSKSDYKRDCGEFSGGWQMRIALAKLLLETPEVLLLDEPTNHLDMDTQRWLELFLADYAGAILLISHDVALLDALTTRTIAFHHGRAEQYAGNFSFYLKESEQRRAILQKQYKDQQKEIAQAQAFIDRFRSKATKAAQVQSRIKALEKIERITLEEDDAVMDFRFPEPPASGQSVAKLEQVHHGYGELELFKDFNFEVRRGEHIAIVGPNGAGKSTFCRLISGQEAPKSGRHAFGHQVSVSFFSQTHADTLDANKTILECAEAAACRQTAGIVRNLLGCFLFVGDDVFKRIGILSGGERSRVALVCMLLAPANFIILDEPTNHLDVLSQDVLQRALKEYPGTAIIVSHNRRFLDPIVEKTLVFTKGEVPTLYAGNLSYYLEKKEESFSSKVGQSQVSSKGGDNRREKRRQEAALRAEKKQTLDPLYKQLEQLEEAISLHEAAKHTLEAHMQDPQTTSDSQALLKASVAYEDLAKQLEASYTQWAKLSEEIEKLEKRFARA